MELAPQYLRDLPHDKDYHLFVSYESSTVEVVRKLVENLESMGITCCYYDRDFTPGESINVNITDAIKNSLHMVVIISDNFQASDYCMHELDQALNLRIRGKYNLIPVKIEPCTVPECLQHIAYIDAEDDIDSAHTKIIDAMAKKEMQKSLRGVTNGESQKFKVLPYKPSRFSLTRYKLSFTETDKTNMWNNQFELPAELFDDIAKTANGSLLFKYLHIWYHKHLAVAMIVLLLCIIISIVFLGVLSQSKPTKQTELPAAAYVLVIGIPILVICWCFVSCLICRHSASWKGIFNVYIRAYSMLNDKIWRLSNQTYNQTGVIFYLHVLNADTPEMISLNFMRYNSKPCKLYFVRRLDLDDDLKKYVRDTETKEECTDRYFDWYLRYHSTSLEIASTKQRHKMANGAKCLCLLVEEWMKMDKG